MIIDIKIPSPGESITEVEIVNWLVSDGDIVSNGQELAEIESDKAVLTLNADKAGKIKILLNTEQTVEVGAIACTIDTDVANKPQNTKISDVSLKKEATETKNVSVEDNKEKKATIANQENVPTANKSSNSEYDKVKITSVARRMMQVDDLSIDDIINGLKRIGKKEINMVKNMSVELENDQSSLPSASPDTTFNKGLSKDVKNRNCERKKMTSLRKKLSKRLVAVKQETAMLTTFNEVDMTNIISMRKKYQKSFVEKHNVKLGFMSFFIKSSALTMQKHPTVNSMIDGDEIVTPEFVDVSVAVQTPKGLMVPVIRNVEVLSLAQIEQTLKELADKARTGKISIDEMTGGTFTVTNGGVFGSMMSTPLINPPQSAILGMHNIVERPIAINGKPVVRPMMYTALSYDHRIIDGKDSVGFLINLKRMLENPQLMLNGGDDLENILLNL